MISITLTTKPPTVNRLYRGRRFLTKEGKETKEAIAWEIKTQYTGEVITDEVTLNIIFYVKNPRSDIDNMLKATCDCLTGLIYKDDSQITELHVYKEQDKVNPRTEIQVL